MPDILAILISERDKLNRAIEAFGGEIGNAVIRLTKVGNPAKRSGSKRTISAEARARMAAAQKARWAKAKVTIPKKGPFKMSAEAKAAISRAKKAWWAAKKKGS
jgi:choline dehydrogenase-like flavoprotein